jgi:hypothetical protein
MKTREQNAEFYCVHFVLRECGNSGKCCVTGTPPSRYDVSTDKGLEDGGEEGSSISSAIVTVANCYKPNRLGLLLIPRSLKQVTARIYILLKSN